MGAAEEREGEGLVSGILFLWGFLKRPRRIRPEKRTAVRLIRVERDGYATAAQAVTRTNLQDNPAVETVVRQILADVKERGDAALLELSRKFDAPELTTLEVLPSALQNAVHEIPADLKAALDLAAANIRRFHEAQKRPSWTDAQPDRITGQLIRPLDRVGVYVPGGTATYFSTVLMAALPAHVAGVPEIILTTPARRDGTVSPAVLYAAMLAGVSRVFTVGGAQAVAALAFGTERVPSVSKIVGPGNSYVNAAKKLLWGVVDIDMLAGPSEVCVVADETANPRFAALDLLTQAEHDTEAAAFLLTPSLALAEEVLAEIKHLLTLLPRADILRKALTENSAAVVTRTLDEAFDLANVCAPEHLALMVRDPFPALGRIKNAGAILLGNYTPQTLGDYLAGPSHTLPTSGTARFASPLHLDTFLKKTNFLYYTQEALTPLIPHLETMARTEGFAAHAEAALARLPKAD